MASLDTDHIRIFVVAEIGHLLGLIDPRVPNYGVRKIVLLNPHLPSRHNVRYYMLLRSILINSISPFTYSNHVTALLIHGALSGLVHEGAPVQAGDLATPHVRNFEISVQKHVETKR